ncbi:MAG: hypothetical protein ACRCTY_08475, partial [Candidatus Adiutrix sp.]
MTINSGAMAHENIEKQTLAVYGLTEQGAQLAYKIALELGASCFLPWRLKDDKWANAEYFETLGQVLETNFHKFTGHVVVGATGLVVRLIAPLLVSKKKDPAVVTVDQRGHF